MFVGLYGLRVAGKDGGEGTHLGRPDTPRGSADGPAGVRPSATATDARTCPETRADGPSGVVCDRRSSHTIRLKGYT